MASISRLTRYRVSDGAEVARCLQVVKRYLEKPLTIAFG